ncbi:hypothetical protein GQ43DRAFT_441189 [Delitschia confertaspora ATCC 74209]|uniref:Uncharacterized protein n=1 Tax=Delitschia confertaspora ATCC 74209 TaxID=1513339 RepID=A0A9P4JK08_9PLEO|nr:hypothetical protein GQ43DRAFT_441189 [Delitschia confertaspora ATCC 74209]
MLRHHGRQAHPRASAYSCTTLSEPAGSCFREFGSLSVFSFTMFFVLCTFGCFIIGRLLYTFRSHI